MQLRRALIIGLVLGHALGLTLSPGRARAQVAGMVISQLQAGGAGSGHASDEFIELYNASAMPLSLDHWALQYRSGTASGDCTQGWSTKLTLPVSTIVMPQTYWLVAASGYLTMADGHFSAGLASTKGAVRLIDSTTQSVDALAWGGASCGMGSSAVTLPDGQSLLRSSSGYSGNNLADFALAMSPAPRSSQTVAPQPTIYPELELSEILVDQAGFIELHNPNDVPVEVSAYGLAIGSEVYHLLPNNLAPDGYLTVATSLSGMVASTSGGQVSLLDPSGVTIDRSEVWPATTAGRSWALSDGGWEWSSLVTPGSANLFPTALSPPSPASNLELSELLPNPSISLNGNLEKYVELYNSGDVALSLDGYTLRSGANLGNHVMIMGQTIGAHSFITLAYSLTHLSLAVGGSKVGLFDPTGNLIGEMVSYGKAPLGQAYAHFDDGWHWTALPTPGIANVLAAAPSLTAKSKSTKSVKTSTKTKSVKSKAVKRAKSPKTTLAKVSRTNFATTPPAPNGRWLLFILLGLTIVYISYEFRLDLQHYYYQCRRYLTARRASRRRPQGPNDPGADQ